MKNVLWLGVLLIDSRYRELQSPGYKRGTTMQEICEGQNLADEEKVSELHPFSSQSSSSTVTCGLICPDLVH
jgi:hypothetical protein